MQRAVAIRCDIPGLEQAVTAAGFEVHPDGWIVLSEAPVDEDLVVVVGIASSPAGALRLAKAGLDHVVVWPGEGLQAVLWTAARSVQHLAQAATYRTAFRASPVWQEISDDAVCLLDVSAGFERATGISRSAAVGRTPAQLFRGGTHRLSYYRNIESTVRTGVLWSGDLLGRRLDGSLAVMDATIGALLRGAEVVGQFSSKVVAGDQQRGSLRAWIADRVESPWILVGEDGRIVEGSRQPVLGVDPETVRNLAFEELEIPLELPSRGETRHIDVWRDGVAWEVTATARPIGEVHVVLVQFDDVTLRKAKAEALDVQARQLADARDQALAADRAKSAFLAAMSHDLRTPLNAILGYAELLEEEIEALDGHPDLHRIQESGRRLLGLVDQLLDLARIESGAVEAEPTAFSVRPLVQEVVDTLAIAASRRGLHLVVEAPDVTVVADRGRVCRILCNLTSNAVKYAVPGRVVVGMHDGAFFVEDEGPGLTEEQRATIFEPFTRLQCTGPGVGLGLALCKRLATVLGGELGVKGTACGGSRFELRLPMVAQAL